MARVFGQMVPLSKIRTTIHPVTLHRMVLTVHVAPQQTLVLAMASASALAGTHTGEVVQISPGMPTHVLRAAEMVPSLSEQVPSSS